MENTFKLFAVLGAGTLGSPLAQSLVDNGASVVVPTCPASEHSKFPSGPTHATVDFTDTPALAEQFRLYNCEAVISAIDHDYLEVQAHTLMAAKIARVELAPSLVYDFSACLGYTKSIVSEINSRQPGYHTYGFTHSGFLMDFIPFFLGVDWNKEVTLIREGKKPAPWISLADVTGYLAHVLTHLPAQELNNSTLRFEGQRYTYPQIAEHYGDSVKVVHTSHFPDDINNPRLRKYLQTKIGMGRALLHTTSRHKDDYKLDKDLWPDHNRLTVDKTLGL